jgi:arylsulfatase A-like enzyme/Flp pilus assembly protein TadD
LFLVLGWLLSTAAAGDGAVWVCEDAARTAGTCLPDVVLVTLDTVRADRIGAYGYSAARTPVLDRLAGQGRLFSRAYAAAPLTIPSHASLFTGEIPSTLGIHGNSSGLRPHDRTWVQALHQAGYRTGASVGAFVVSQTWGFGRGFDDYYGVFEGAGSERPGSAVVDDLVAWEAGRDGRPLFAWVHLYDAHSWARPGAGGPTYDDRIAEVDALVGRVVEAFGDRPTLFVVASDHGEGLGDHAEQKHGLFVYNSTVHVPLLMVGPGVPAERVDEVVSLVDLGPTLLHYLGLPPLSSGAGRVMLSSPARPVVMEAFALRTHFRLAPQRAVVQGDMKWIDVPEPELYDLSVDPTEAHNLAGSRPEVLERLARWLPAEAASDSAPSLDAATQLQLAALGYVDGLEAVEAGEALPDAKLHMDLVLGVQAVDALREVGAYAQALTAVQQLMASHPGLRVLLLRERDLHAEMGDLAAAVAVAAALVQNADPNSTLDRRGLADLLLRAGRFAEAGEQLQRVAELSPGDHQVRARAVRAFLTSTDRVGEGMRLGVRYLAEDATNASVAGLVGMGLIQVGQPERAVPLLELGTTAQLPEPNVCFALSRVRAQQGRGPEARALLQAELEHHPTSFLAAITLGDLLLKEGDHKGVLQAVSGVLDAGAGKAHGVAVALLWDMRAQAHLGLGALAQARRAVELGLALDPGSRELAVTMERLRLRE